MEVVAQSLVDILDSLRALTVDWQDDVALRVIERIRALPVKATYGEGDVKAVLEGGDFEEAKGYGATGSKMTDIIGDIEKIIAAKRGDTAFLFFTDGLTRKQRQSDLRKIVESQNQGDITRIYTYTMAERCEAGLRQLKTEFDL